MAVNESLLSLYLKSKGKESHSTITVSDLNVEETRSLIETLEKAKNSTL